MRSIVLVSGCIAMWLLGVPAHAKELVVHMRNKGTEGAMVFEPSYVEAAIGDTVRFLPTDLGHNSEPIAGMMPTGVTLPSGKMNKEYAVKLTKSGLYGFKCLPHFGMGMVALVKVGTPTAAEVASARTVKVPPVAAKRLQPMFDKIK